MSQGKNILGNQRHRPSWPGGAMALIARYAFALTHYRCSGCIVLIVAENRAWSFGSTGLCLTAVLAGSFPR